MVSSLEGLIVLRRNSSMRWIVFLWMSLAFVAKAETGKVNILILIAEREYLTHQTLPVFVKEHLEWADVKILHPAKDDRDTFPGLEKVIKEADLLFVSVRRRALPVAQLDAVKDYVKSGKPVVGIRTANHAFALNRSQVLRQGHAVWQEWDNEVFGGSYSGHHGNKLKTTALRFQGVEHEIQKNMPKERFRTGGSLSSFPSGNAPKTDPPPKRFGRPVAAVFWPGFDRFSLSDDPSVLRGSGNGSPGDHTNLPHRHCHPALR